MHTEVLHWSPLQHLHINKKGALGMQASGVKYQARAQWQIFYTDTRIQNFDMNSFKFGQQETWWLVVLLFSLR